MPIPQTPKMSKDHLCLREGSAHQPAMLQDNLTHQDAKQSIYKTILCGKLGRDESRLRMPKTTLCVREGLVHQLLLNLSSWMRHEGCMTT